MPEPAHRRATRTSYYTVAVDYAEVVRADLAAKALDRAMLATFAELVQATGAGPIADVGCGPGRVTAHLHSLGVSAFGVDLSPGMVAVARRTYPGLRFDEGSMTALDIADDALGGVVAWYSIIHTPPEVLPSVIAEFRRVPAPGGELLLAFQVGDERVHLQHGYGRDVSLHAYRLSPDDIAELATQAGLVVHTRMIRERAEALVSDHAAVFRGSEKTPQAYLMARRPV